MAVEPVAANSSSVYSCSEGARSLPVSGRRGSAPPTAAAFFFAAAAVAAGAVGCGAAGCAGVEAGVGAVVAEEASEGAGVEEEEETGAGAAAEAEGSREFVVAEADGRVAVEGAEVAGSAGGSGSAVCCERRANKRKSVKSQMKECKKGGNSMQCGNTDLCFRV